MAKPIYPGLKHITSEEASFLARVCREDGDDTKQAEELLTCIDDCLGIQKKAAPSDDHRTTIDALEKRIMQADILRKI
ncbi:hypothetical protein [Alistipes sp.]|jgi:hypothetical protein|uniref:hypothetical protein n=1 Tax=Alistipes sp. TaxID=1872444 RepID=UPI00206B6E11|nr:MAG TPA_asm: hypothetical protein [Caudoviricetes sp.]